MWEPPDFILLDSDPVPKDFDDMPTSPVDVIALRPSVRQKRINIGYGSASRWRNDDAALIGQLLVQARFIARRNGCIIKLIAPEGEVLAAIDPSGQVLL